jgi:hypothetical protein
LWKKKSVATRLSFGRRTVQSDTGTGKKKRNETNLPTVRYGRNATATDVDGRYHGETTTGRGEFADARVYGGTVFDDVFDDDDGGGEWWETGARDASVEDDDRGWNVFD